MKCIFIVLLFVFLQISFSCAFFTPIDRQVLAANYLTSTCGCRDFHYLCPFMYSRCSDPANRRVRLMCPLSCALCVACPAELNPTLTPTPRPCEFDCSDLSPPALCAWFKTRFFCPFTRALCRETCEECNRCIVPPVTPAPCKEDCRDRVSQKNCAFWSQRGFCNPEGRYPNVPYLCELTCNQCSECTE